MFFVILVAGCHSKLTPEPTLTPPPVQDLPHITSVALDRVELPRYESLKMVISLDAQYTNPYDARQVSGDLAFKLEHKP